MKKHSHIILRGDNINQLYKSIVILSASLIEIVFKEYMFNLIVSKTNKLTTEKMMFKLSRRSIEEHLSQIDVFFEKDLKAEMEEFESGFYVKWTNLRKEERNKLIHKNSIYISSKRVEEIFYLAKSSINIFSQLSNVII